MKEVNNKKVERSEELLFKLMVPDLVLFSSYLDLKMADKELKRLGPIFYEILNYYECEHCGFCCRREPVRLTDEDVERLLKHEKDSFFEKLDEKSIENYLKCPCPYLLNDRCSIYENRPEICRLFPFIQAFGVPSLALCPLGLKIFGDLEGFVKKIDKEAYKTMKDKKIDKELQNWVDFSDSVYRKLRADDDDKKDKKLRMVAMSSRLLEDFYKHLKQVKKLKHL